VNREIIEAWQPFMNFSIKAMRYESKPENVSMISADPAIVAVYRIELGSEDVEMRIGYPYSLLKESLNESLLHLANHSRKEKLTDEQLKAYEQTLTRVNVRVQPLLGTTRLTINDLINLKEGDTIPLSQKTDQPLEVRVNGVKKMTAYPGSVKSRRAVKIYELQDQINEQELL
ncbi:MAG: FliM/FliN family flagellar motor switch protein, partial [Balneolales bacterium]